ncbi:alpha-catulin-like [Stylophora pistillata]|uniref:alpha-catulin-like n=1 Tax=Stylophora pistillata TaxID=50429 RepID=UPI000C046501|nr:alpha-catulin-like [Stylophora pistillata]
MAKWDSKNLEIRSKSVEQTLVPLVTQITTLVNHKDHGRRSERALKAIHEIGKVVALAVERFVSVGEQIASENEDVAEEMRMACEEAKKSGQTIFTLTSFTGDSINGDGVPNGTDKTNMVRAARSLLSAVTRVLIIADSVVVKRLLAAVKKVDDRLKQLETVNTFTDFVQAFSQFGSDMVELAHLSGDRQNDLKDDTLKAEMGAARSILEKSTMMLLTTSKTCLRHPDSRSAKGNREGVFKKMREAMATITSVVQDEHKEEDTEKGCLAMDLVHFEACLEAYKQSSPDDSESKIKFQKAFANILDDVQSVMDSPHMRKEKREKILALCENAQDIMKDILERQKNNKNEDATSIDTLDMALQRICKTSKDLRHEVHQVATDQVFETFSHLGHKKSLPALRNAAASGSSAQLESLANVFTQDAKRLQEVSRVTRNMASNKPMAITAKKVEENIDTLCPQVIHAARTLAAHPVSKIAQENMEVFVDVWEAQVEELGKVLRLITAGGDPSKNVLSEDETQGLRKTSESRVEQLLQKSSSRRSSSASVEENEEPEKAVVDSQEQEKLGKLITNVNLMTSQLELHYFEDTDNEIVIRAREMSEMVSEMYLFTRGEGALQTTEELFEASQNFADAGKALYRVARKYASKAEESPIKKELLRYVDKIPAYCHQLLFTSRSLAIGQAACCRKVWGVMHLTKNIIKIVARVVNSCYLLAERNSPLKLPPDQRLWQIDESIFSEESSLATLSRCSSLQSIENNESEQRTTAEHSNGVVYKTEL